MKKILPSTDGLARAVEIKTKNGTTNRPLSKLFPLELIFDIDEKEYDETPSASKDKNNTTNEIETRPRRHAAIDARRKVQEQLDILDRS